MLNDLPFWHILVRDSIRLHDSAASHTRMRECSGLAYNINVTEKLLCNSKLAQTDSFNQV